MSTETPRHAERSSGRVASVALRFALDSLHDRLHRRLVIPRRGHEEAPGELRGLGRPRGLVDRVVSSVFAPGPVARRSHSDELSGADWKAIRPDKALFCSVLRGRAGGQSRTISGRLGLGAKGTDGWQTRKFWPGGRRFAPAAHLWRLGATRPTDLRPSRKGPLCAESYRAVFSTARTARDSGTACSR